ncbi:bli-3 [Trichoderma arundinaceum]|uniref:Bli-3 n=1 Tax=Trichoderma arundinaceum TaxID=490622 RepID=A0A395N929_TRIAR|nr:bli-3 [Trichoderma arundinaceum]
MATTSADLGDKPADPYTKANKDEVDSQTMVTDLVDFITKCKFGMLTTVEASSHNNLVSRCMGLAATESGGIDLLFHTNTESGKTNDLSNDPHVNVSFINSSGEWASISGQASVVTDRELVKKTYSSGLKAWLGDLGDGVHDGSENDPRIGIIRVKTTTVTYSLVSGNFISRAAEVAQGVLTGKPAQVNRLREISAEDVKNWRASNV